MALINLAREGLDGLMPWLVGQGIVLNVRSCDEDIVGYLADWYRALEQMIPYFERHLKPAGHTMFAFADEPLQ